MASRSMILAGTHDGVAVVGEDRSRWLAGTRIDALAVVGGDVWAVGDGATIWHGDLGGAPREVATLEDGRANCLIPTAGGLLVGGSEARLFRVDGSRLVSVPGFDEAPGRDQWHTPWGGPPDVRSLATDRNGNVYVNVHVGGVLRSVNGGREWAETMDISADVHEVTTHPGQPGVCFAAAAIGLGVSTDGAASWDWVTTGLHAVYCRAVAVTGDHLLVSASTGPGGRRAAVYRTSAAVPTSLERCSAGLPEWFPDNIDTFCLAGSGDLSVIGSSDGSVYASADGGDSWEAVGGGLTGLRCVAVV